MFPEQSTKTQLGRTWLNRPDLKAIMSIKYSLVCQKLAQICKLINAFQSLWRVELELSSRAVFMGQVREKPGPSPFEKYKYMWSGPFNI